MSTRRPWSAADLAMLRERYPHEPTARVAAALGRSVPSVYGQAEKLGLRKTAAYLASPAACRLRRGDAIGFAYRFPKGHVPANKGVKGWQAGGRSVETRFRRGNVSVRWDPEIYIVGALRITSDGELQMKVAPGNRSWLGLAQYEWAMHHGGRLPPRGHVLRHRNGDAHDPRIDNLECITCAENMRRNSLHNLPKPLVHVIQLRTALNRRLARVADERAAA